jgi:hypothetical protein
MNDGTFPFEWFPINERKRIADSADIDKWLMKIKIPAGTAPVPKKAIEKIKKEEVST